MQEQESSIAAASSSSPPAPEAGSHVTTEVVPPASGLPSTGSLFWVRRRNDWGLRFYIRVDLQGSFHTYPDLDGPFQSLQEAQNAIDRHLDARRVPKMCMEQAKVSVTEMAIRKCLYWPDGTRKKCSKSHAIEKDCDDKRRFVQALVDNYNKDHNLFGVCSLPPSLSVLLPGILHMNLKMFCIANQFLRTVWCTIISISQQRLKELMILTLAPTIYSLLKCKVSDKENMKNWWSAVSAWLSLLIMVFYTLILD
ncbi:uncharacterized protein LOC100837750 [Brachypodium distachyon]|uniref:uncharacterized protein LOC100837750 n=1 Tax=Brachypodium distachyon TaxID=15368 RepID=UPI000D0D9DDD|nr:uncharacterized protein LOC100837750 [Brachypodium distachyon]|eukprot:XP_024314357.1 uncharacterized protein LOC100837750 [Brachypodium distachyon]